MNYCYNFSYTFDEKRLPYKPYILNYSSAETIAGTDYRYYTFDFSNNKSMLWYVSVDGGVNASALVRSNTGNIGSTIQIFYSTFQEITSIGNYKLKIKSLSYYDIKAYLIIG